MSDWPMEGPKTGTRAGQGSGAAGQRACGSRKVAAGLECSVFPRGTRAPAPGCVLVLSSFSRPRSPSCPPFFLPPVPPHSHSTSPPSSTTTHIRTHRAPPRTHAHPHTDADTEPTPTTTTTAYITATTTTTTTTSGSSSTI